MTALVTSTKVAGEGSLHRRAVEVPSPSVLGTLSPRRLAVPVPESRSVSLPGLRLRWAAGVPVPVTVCVDRDRPGRGRRIGGNTSSKTSVRVRRADLPQDFQFSGSK